MTITLPVTVRDTSKNAEVREEGGIPAIVYGPKQEAIAITLPGKTFEKVRQEAGESTLVELTGLEEPIEVLIKDVEFSPIKQRIVHVDFYAVERGKDMTTNIALEFVGEAPIEKSGEGSVTRVLHEVTVTCRPSNLPSGFEIDLSSLATVEDKITVADLVAPEGVTIDTDPEEAIAVVSLAQEEPEEEPEAVDMDAIEVEAKGKAEEGGEGAEPEAEKAE